MIATAKLITPLVPGRCVGLVKLIFRATAGAVLIPFGWAFHVLTGRTPIWAHRALIDLFCLTGGRFNDWISWFLGMWRPPVPFEQAVGVLGDLRGAARSTLLAQLRKQGCCVFPSALPQPVCERLVRFALTTEAILRRMDGEVDAVDRQGRFDPARPMVVRYDYPTEALLAQSDVQDLLADTSLLALAQAYLGARPRADVLSMWWHTNFKDKADAEAAQYFHFDMDRARWLKVFIYLTDVGPDNGPHTFVAGSHRTGGIPWRFLRRGYVRLEDDEVLAHYGSDKLIQFTAPRGTVIVEDTRGLHKGVNVTGKPRLMLQLQLSNSLFGAKYARSRLPSSVTDALERRLVNDPDVYASFR